MAKTVTISVEDFEHLLNCMCNQKYLHEFPAKDALDAQKIIDKAWSEGMELLTRKQHENGCSTKDASNPEKRVANKENSMVCESAQQRDVFFTE